MRSFLRRLTQRHHALDGTPRPLGDLGIDGDLVAHRLERPADLWQGDPLHMRAQIAWSHKFELGILQRNIVAH